MALNYTNSTQLYKRALGLLPGGVNSPVRAMRSIGRDPIFIRKANGAWLTDVDGNRYIDYVCSWGPLIAGHAHPDVVEAVTIAAKLGTSFGAPTEAEVELAAEIVDRVPSAEMARMTTSGTEAAMSAIRLARAATGRDKVIKFAGAYHGHVDGLLAEAGSGMATAAVPASPGVTAAQSAATVVLPWNDEDALKEAVAALNDDLAAVIAEPLPANMGLVPPAEGFLSLLRELTGEAGALLILDEVISGFRAARGGAQEVYGIDCDLTVLGKVMGGGLPSAAYAGRRELMEMVAPAGDVYQAGTLAGNPISMAAGLATLKLLDGDAYRKLASYSETLATGLAACAKDAGVEVQVQWATGLLTVFFSEHPVRSYRDAAACDSEAYASLCRALLERGVYAPASQFEAWFPSLAHGDGELAQTIEAAAQAFRASR